MKSIVAPVNFTANSGNAARYAADLALAIQADLHLFHALQIPVSVADVPMPNHVFEELEAGAKTTLSQLREELVQRTGGKIRVSVHMEVGSVEHNIEEFCRRKTPFAIVMGTSGHSLERFFSGSHLPAAIRHLPYPLIVVPKDTEFHPIKKILVACGLTDMAEGIPVATSFLKELKDHFDCHFDVINICTPRQDDQSEAEATFQFNSWKDRLQEAYPEVHFVKMNKVEEGIEEYVSKHPTDIIMVFPRRHGLLEFHRSHSKQLAMHSNVPVMSIHA
ncbi:MAG: universal stress protein [Bacteroidota bacterium]|nr:universal stress protein [Bacteroidota bacterium]MDP4215578.1 universal stress protein [Bacteroidota bacterium]MDP4246200.1 universal stress protein [Bacteroidota bacterium]MDP4253825.1 universal stress protein [Bacteroidota bacterium]MDP4257769.1 universal stress protein [Bacteroidota bacterium]